MVSLKAGPRLKLRPKGFLIMGHNVSHEKLNQLPMRIHSTSPAKPYATARPCEMFQEIICLLAYVQ